ncbi:GIY-YIG nuclease family protein [Streptomyces anulatus]|uniref:GIY-YIG nuclease family protein n=1 Tax=Streptomyces anulatus TaxID=1892 RepID=UPI003642DF72
MNEERVYVIGTPGSKTVKIGRSIDLPKRHAEIQRMSPVPLSLLWSHPGDHTLETNLHRQFSGLRVHGEWFTFQADPVTMVAWAVKTKPWGEPKISLKKPRYLRRSHPRASDRSSAEERANWRQETRAALAGILEEVRSIQDPLERLAAARKVEGLLGAALRSEAQRAVVDLKGQGLAWREVGELLEMSGQRAHQISLGGSPTYGRKKT